MTMQRYPLTAEGVTREVARWYANATDGEAAVLLRPEPPAVWLVRLPHAQVYWRTEGSSGLTVSLADAQQRLAMVQARGLLSCVPRTRARTMPSR